MLTIEPPFYFIRGVTLFRDHQDLDQFYMLPGSPRMTSFTLYKYKVSIAADGSDPTRAPGAGLALFEVEVPPGDLSKLTTDLASATGRDKARVAPVMFSSAEVHALVPRPDGDKLFDDLVETHAAPLVSPYHTAFALALSATGASLMESATTDGSIPVGVVYELRFLALTPALHARVTMNYVEAYNRFSASLGFQYYIKVGLDLDIAWLVEHDFIKIDILSYVDNADEQRQRDLVMQLVTARVQRDFFRSGLPKGQDSPAPSGALGALVGGGASGSGSNVSSGTAMFVLKAKYEVDNQSKELVLTYDSRTAVELTHTVAGHLSSMVQGQSPKILSIDTKDSFFSKLEVKVLSVIDFDALADLREAAVDFSFGDVRQPYSFDAKSNGPFAFAAALADPSQDQYSYDVQYDFDLDQGHGPARIVVGPLGSRSRVLVVDPLLHFHRREVRFALGPLDPAEVPRVHLRVRVPAADPGAPDLAREEVILDGHAPVDYLFRVHAPLDAGPLRVRARATWEDPHGQMHEGDEVEVTSNVYMVLGPYVDTIPLYVAPAVDWALVTQVSIEVRYRDGDYIVDKTLDFSSAKSAGQRLELPLLDATKRRYSWRQTVFKADGTRVQTDFADADSSVLAPTALPKTTADLRIVWLGAAGDALGLRVDVWAQTPAGEEQLASAFLRAGVDGDKTMTLPLDADGKLAYRYEARKETAAGETLVRAATAQSSPLLVLQTG